MGKTTGLLCLVLSGCLSRTRAVTPAAPISTKATTAGEPTEVAHRDLTPFAQPSQSSVTSDPTLFAQQPAPHQPAPQQPQPPQPQPYPPQQQGYPPQQPYPPQPQGYPPQQPYPPQPYPPQPQGYPPQPYGYPYPPPPQEPLPPPRPSRIHDGEVIGDFASVGALASIDIIVRQDVQNGGVGTMILIAGVVGGGAAGWLLTERYPVNAGSAHATTLGLLVGAANGALLIEPTGWTRPESVIGLLFFGSAIGATGGFLYGQTAKLTAGQATFVGNVTLLGVATAALGAIAGSSDQKFGHWENGTLAIGLDAGLLAGALVAPKLDWSARRSKIVFAATGVGALAGGMLAGLTTNNRSTSPDGSTSSDPNGDVVAWSMTAGMWAGFGIGALMTRDSAPDPKFSQSSRGAASAPTTYAPWVGDQGRLGIMAGGTW
jgi:hypothetical protein